MASRLLEVPGLGQVAFQKRRGARNIRLRIDAKGSAIVTLPYIVPYAVAVRFAAQHADWVRAEQQKHVVALPHGMPVGRAHTLRFIGGSLVDKPKTRVTAQDVIVRYNGEITDTTVQAAAQAAVRRALKQEAEHFLPQRLSMIAAHEGYTYAGCTIKQLRGRWGSCDQNKAITLNSFLMQLPVELIDYVIYHELAHTRAMNHGADFWKELEAHLPNARQLRKQIRQYQPAVPARPDMLHAV